MKILQAVGAAALMGTAVVAAIQTTGGAHPVKATANPGDGNVRIVNVSDQGFAVAWTTKAAYSGSKVLYGTTCAGATSSVNELPSNGTVHLANVGGLQPNTNYYYKLLVNGVTDNNSGTCYHGSTFATQVQPPAPAAVYGQARHAACNSSSSAAGSLVVLTDGASSPLAAITDSKGRWALPFGDLTDSSGVYVNPVAGSIFTILLTTDAYHSHALSTDGVGTDPHAYDGTAQTVGPLTVCTVPAPAKVTIDSATVSATYNAKSHAVTATTDPAGISYTVKYNGSSAAPTNAGSYPVAVTISDSEWTGSTTGTLHIAKAGLKVTASSGSITFGQAIPAIKPTFSGFLGADTAAVVSGTPSCATTATASSGAGVYATTCGVSGLSATNYTFTAVPGKLTIARAQPVIAYTGKSTLKHGAKAVLSAKLTSTVTRGAINGRSMTFALGSQTCSAATNSSGVAACTIKKVSGKAGKRMLTITFAGDQPGAAYDYLSATLTHTIKIK